MSVIETLADMGAWCEPRRWWTMFADPQVERQQCLHFVFNNGHGNGIAGGEPPQRWQGLLFWKSRDRSLRGVRVQQERRILTGWGHSTCETDYSPTGRRTAHPCPEYPWVRIEIPLNPRLSATIEHWDGGNINSLIGGYPGAAHNPPEGPGRTIAKAEVWPSGMGELVFDDEESRWWLIYRKTTAGMTYYG